MTDDALQPLRFLIAQAERQREEALAELMKAESGRRAAAAKADDLVSYRRDYEQRWSAQFCREGQIELVRCYQAFMERLSQAIDQQAHVAAEAVMLVERATAMVRGHEQRAAGLNKLLERRQREGRIDAERGEQRQSDDRAARTAWTQAHGNGFNAAI